MDLTNNNNDYFVFSIELNASYLVVYNECISMQYNHCTRWSFKLRESTIVPERFVELFDSFKRLMTVAILNYYLLTMILSDRDIKNSEKHYKRLLVVLWFQYHGFLLGYTIIVWHYCQCSRYYENKMKKIKTSHRRRLN